MLITEAHKVYQSMSEDEVRTFVTKEDFQYLWRHVNEQIESSRSNLHFGHYKDAAHNDDL